MTTAKPWTRFVYAYGSRGFEITARTAGLQQSLTATCLEMSERWRPREGCVATIATELKGRDGRPWLVAAALRTIVHSQGGRTALERVFAAILRHEAAGAGVGPADLILALPPFDATGDLDDGPAPTIRSEESPPAAVAARLWAALVEGRTVVFEGDDPDRELGVVNAILPLLPVSMFTPLAFGLSGKARLPVEPVLTDARFAEASGMSGALRIAIGGEPVPLRPLEMWFSDVIAPRRDAGDARAVIHRKYDRWEQILGSRPLPSDIRAFALAEIVAEAGRAGNLGSSADALREGRNDVSFWFLLANDWPGTGDDARTLVTCDGGPSGPAREAAANWLGGVWVHSVLRQLDDDAAIVVPFPDPDASHDGQDALLLQAAERAFWPLFAMLLTRFARAGGAGLGGLLAERDRTEGTTRQRLGPFPRQHGDRLTERLSRIVRALPHDTRVRALPNTIPREVRDRLEGCTSGPVDNPLRLRPLVERLADYAEVKQPVSPQLAAALATMIREMKRGEMAHAPRIGGTLNPRRPATAVCNLARVPDAKAFRGWLPRAGVITGILSFLYFMTLAVLAASETVRFYQSAEFPLVIVFGLGVGFSAALLAGAATATGRLPIRWLRDNPAMLSVGGGVAVAIVCVMFGTAVYRELSFVSETVHIQTDDQKPVLAEVCLSVGARQMRQSTNEQGDAFFEIPRRHRGDQVTLEVACNASVVLHRTIHLTGEYHVETLKGDCGRQPDGLTERVRRGETAEELGY